jgi:sulfonate transport system permease protein
MTDTRGAPALAQLPAAPDAQPAPQAREVFAAAGARRTSVLTTWRTRLSWPLGIYTTPLAILLIWQALADAGILSTTAAPAPTVIAQTGWHLWQQGVLGPDLEISLLHRALVGFALGLGLGVIAGVLGGLLRSGEYLLNGIVQIFNTIPILAILPVMIVWFGIGEKPKILIIAFGAFVPIYLNLFAGIRSVDQRLVEMARTTGAGTWRLVTRVMFPGALPGFLIGLRFALAYSILGLVAAETVNANSGIGFLITNGQTYMQPDQVWVGLVIYAILGLLADQFVRLLQRVLLRWRPSYEAR